MSVSIFIISIPKDLFGDWLIPGHCIVYTILLGDFILRVDGVIYPTGIRMNDGL